MRILFVSPYVPSPIRVRPYYWIKSLAARGHEILLFTILRRPADEADLDAIRPACVRVTTAHLSSWRPIWNSARSLLTADPVQLAWSRLPRLARAIRAAAEHEPDAVAHIEHLRGASFAPALASLPIVYDAVDSISLLFSQTRSAGPRLSDRWLASLDVRRTARFEASMLSRFDRVLISSPVDAARIRDLSADATTAERLVVLPNPVDLEYFQSTPGPRDPATLIFSGKMSYHANIAAVLHLATDVMPAIWRHRAEVRLLVVGQDPDASVRRLARDPRISVTGYVPDLRPFLARATLAVCPMLYGVGIQNKVLEAMASGVPVVASPRVAQALDAEIGVDLSVADSPDPFAREVLRLLGAPDARAALTVRGRAYVERHHAPSLLVGRLEQTYREAARSAAGRRGSAATL